MQARQRLGAAHHGHLAIPATEKLDGPAASPAPPPSPSTPPSTASASTTSPRPTSQTVRDLTRHLDPATLRQVMSWLERTRTAALALRGTEQAPPVRPMARRTQF
ncbi:hypothetical protein [Kitasatospora sp. NPDC001683]